MCVCEGGGGRRKTGGGGRKEDIKESNQANQGLWLILSNCFLSLKRETNNSNTMMASRKHLWHLLLLASFIMVVMSSDELAGKYKPQAMEARASGQAVVEAGAVEKSKRNPREISP